MHNYNPFDWYWIVSGDETRFWSSATGAFVATLPDGADLTRIGSEGDLTDVLAVYGLPGPLPRPYWLYKSTFIRRMTLAEAELFEAGIIAQPAWMRLLYNSVEYFVSSDALIQALNAELAFALGELLGDPLAGQARADDLLGPPTVQEAAALTPQTA
jgi:hypothetical protein